MPVRRGTSLLGPRCVLHVCVAVRKGANFVYEAARTPALVDGPSPHRLPVLEVLTGPRCLLPPGTPVDPSRPYPLFPVTLNSGDSPFVTEQHPHTGQTSTLTPEGSDVPSPPHWCP